MKKLSKLLLPLIAIAALGIPMSSSASAEDDANKCYRIAESTGTIAFDMLASERKLTGKLKIVGKVQPIPANGGANATEAVKAYTYAQCRQAVDATLTVTKSGKRVYRKAFKGFSDPATGTLTMSQTVSKTYARVKKFATIRYRLKVHIFDKDQTVTYLDKSGSGRINRKTKTVRIR